MDDLKLIKKYYGENMAHLCRSLFPTILETEGLLFYLLDTHFYHSRNLYEDIVKQRQINAFKMYINRLINKNDDEYLAIKSAKELLDEAGYILYECKTENDIQEFRKYYADGEELCTFREKRLNSNYVFFAVKKNANSIKREDFKHPERQDEYGTSVISIQFSRTDNLLSIKNRYNHKVLNPDATFSNNLDNIIPGLTNAFENDYGLKIKYEKNNFELNNYVFASDRKFYPYNYEINNIYYGPDNIIIDNGIVIDKYRDKNNSKSRYIVLDYFIIDIKEKKLFLYDKKINDCFENMYYSFDKIAVKNNNDCKVIVITYDNDKELKMTLNKNNQIIEFTDNNIEEIGNNFLKYNTEISKINIDNVKKIGDYFLHCNKNVIMCNLPNVIKIGNYFMICNIIMEKFIAPKVIYIGKNFLYSNTMLNEINVSNLEYVDIFFLSENIELKTFYASKLSKIKSNFLSSNTKLEIVYLPSLVSVEDSFLRSAENMKCASFDNLVDIGFGFMSFAKNLQYLNLPKAKTIGHNFLNHNIKLMAVNIPNVISVGDNFLTNNENLYSIVLSNLEFAGDNFLQKNKFLNLFSAPKLTSLGECAFEYNDGIEFLCLESLTDTGCYLLSYNTKLKTYVAPKQEKIRHGSLERAKDIERVVLPNNCDIYFHCFAKYNSERDELIDSIKENGYWEKVYSKQKLLA